MWHPWTGLQSPCGGNHVKFVLGFPSSWSDNTIRRQCCGHCSCSPSFPFFTLSNWKTCNPHTGLPTQPPSPCSASPSPSSALGPHRNCFRSGRGLTFVAAYFFFFFLQGGEKMWSWPQSEHTDSWVPVVAGFLEAGWHAVAKLMLHLITHNHLLSSLGSP